MVQHRTSWQGPPLGTIILRRLDPHSVFSEAERAQVFALGPPFESHAAGDDFPHTGAAARSPRFLVSGWAFRYRHLRDGRRQIVGFLLPGDCVGEFIRQRPLSAMPVRAITLTQLVHADALGEGQGLHRALADVIDEEDTLTLDQVVRLGRQTAYERVVHLMLELYHRLDRVGLTNAGTMPLPLTQELLADALGLSIVHVNRTLQQLRREERIEVHAGKARLSDLNSLANLCDFSPASDRLVAAHD